MFTSTPSPNFFCRVEFTNSWCRRAFNAVLQISTHCYIETTSDHPVEDVKYKFIEHFLWLFCVGLIYIFRLLNKDNIETSDFTSNFPRYPFYFIANVFFRISVEVLNSQSWLCYCLNNPLGKCKGRRYMEALWGGGASVLWDGYWVLMREQ